MRTLKFALRTLYRSPFVTAIALVSLALGIGANAAIFSLFNQMLLRPLPVHEADRLVNLAAPGPKPGSTSCGNAGDCGSVFSYPMFRDLEKQQSPFTGIAAHRSFGANLSYQGQTLGGESVLVSGSYFPVLGLTPALGRLLGPQDDGPIGEPHVVVLSYDYWRTRFGASPGILNQTMVVNGQPMTIVGVAPEGFTGTTLGVRPRVYVPITMRGLMEPTFRGFERRQNYWVYLFARLKPDVTIDQARVAINAAYQPIINTVEAPLQSGMSAPTLARFRAKVVEVTEGARGQSVVRAEASAPLVVLMCVTGVVLLIACANIANLLLARAAGRSTEMAVRLAIGASRAQLVRQLLAESALLGLLGGVAGLLVARWTLAAIQALLPNDAAETVQFSLDRTALLFALGLSLATGVLFGLMPAWHSTRPNLAGTLKHQAGQPGGSRAVKWTRASTATVQVTLSMALLVMAGLFTKSLVNVSKVDLGLDIDNVVTFGIAPRMNGYTAERARALFEQTETALAAVPGVTAVTASLVPLLAGSNWGSNLSVQGFQGGPDVDSNARFNEVGPGYFRTMGVPLRAGREFTDADTAGRAKVAIVNETFVKKFQLGREALGKRMAQGVGNAVVLDTEIVGVVADAKYSEVKDAIPAMFFLPYRQDTQIGFATFYVRTARDPDAVLREIPAVVARLDPNLPVANLRTLPQQVRENVFLDRMISTLAAAFAVLATLLAATGLYGVLAYAVTQRTREFGLRMALGADPARVRRIVLAQVGRMVAVGGAIGIGLAVLLGRHAKSLLFELEGHDPTVLAASAGGMVVVALAAGLIPAIRAARVDPMTALRYE
jgi:predicted permease